MIYIFFMINVESPFWSCRIEMELAYIFRFGIILIFLKSATIIQYTIKGRFMSR